MEVANMRIRLLYVMASLCMLNVSSLLFAATDSTAVVIPVSLTKRKICNATVFDGVDITSTSKSIEQYITACIPWAPGNNGSNAFFVWSPFFGSGPTQPSGGGNLNAICPTDHPYVTSYVEKWTTFNILLGGNYRAGIVDDSVRCCATPPHIYTNLAKWDNADANDKCAGTGI
jgi:hypothetical protein